MIQSLTTFAGSGEHGLAFGRPRGRKEVGEGCLEDRYAKKWRALIGISMLSIPAFIDYSIVNAILPGIQARSPA